MQPTIDRFLYTGSTVVVALIYVAAFFVVAAGWKREHHYAYALLMAWAIISFFLSVSSMVQLLFLRQFQLGTTIAGISWMRLYSFATIVGRLLASGLLLAGLWMLVFRRSVPQNPGQESN